VSTAPPAVLGTAQQHATEALRALIVRGDLRPGQRVNQEDLAAQLGRGYFVTELRFGDLQEIYALRAILEERAARQALPALDDEALERIAEAARDCVEAAEAGDVAAELAANRRFHFAILAAPGHPHVMRVIRLLWDSTEAYRAMYYNSPAERHEAVAAHERILAALRANDADRLVAELDAHRARALDVLGTILAA